MPNWMPSLSHGRLISGSCCLLNVSEPRTAWIGLPRKHGCAERTAQDSACTGGVLLCYSSTRHRLPIDFPMPDRLTLRTPPVAPVPVRRRTRACASRHPWHPHTAALAEKRFVADPRAACCMPPSSQVPRLELREGTGRNRRFVGPPVMGNFDGAATGWPGPCCRGCRQISATALALLPGAAVPCTDWFITLSHWAAPAPAGAIFSPPPLRGGRSISWLQLLLFTACTSG